jgi:superfamily II DNA or RNA helicase
MRVTRTGYVIPADEAARKELTVRPIVNNEFGVQPPAFKVFKGKGNTMCVPYHWGVEKYGHPSEDTRPPPARMAPHVRFTGTLRDATHQNEAQRLALEQGHGILSLPCGYGKTTVALSIACTLGLRTMIIVHKDFLANQWMERIQEFCPGATIGRVQQNKVETDCDFVIAMLQSLSMKEYPFETFENIGTVIVDEAHHICAQVFSQSLFKMCPRHIYGLSATPVRKDGLTRVLHWFMGPSFFAVERTGQTQVRVHTEWFTHELYKQPPPVNRCGKVSLTQMITDIIEIPERNAKIHEIITQCLREGRKVLVLSDRRNHCEEIVSGFPEHVAGLYMGGMTREALAQSSEKQLIVGTYTLAHEGLDIPTLDTLVMATPKSDIKQAVGRILRETHGKKHTPLIYDVCDSWCLFIAMHHKRKRVYREGGFLEATAGTGEPESEPKLSGFSFVTGPT